MKKYIKLIVMAAVFVILLSCTKYLTKTPKIDNFAKLDFTKYTEKGFLFSPYQYNGDYEAIGVINYEFIPSATYKREKKISKNLQKKDGQKKVYWVGSWIKDSYNVYDLLDSIYNWSQTKGANAIIDLKLNAKKQFFGYGFRNPVTMDGIEITGFAIKRK